MPIVDNESFLNDMSYHSLQNMRSHHPAWRLLAGTSAPMVLSFLHSVFIARNCRELPEYRLMSQLTEHLERCGEQGDPKTLLAYWSDDKCGYLRKFYPADSDEVHYDLTAAAQKAIEWIERLNTHQFVGTESRLLLVFQLFHEIARQSDEDPQRRIQELERRKAELEDELLRVRQGQVSVLEPVQIKERYLQAMSLSREIVADFRAVEQNFRDLRRAMQEKISSWDKGKGELVGDFFRDQDSIQQSDQGRSFQAFFDFLMSRAAQDDFEQTVKEVGALDAVKQLPGSHDAHRIIRDWVDGGKHVQQTLAAVSEQLRRYVDENFLEEERRINQIMKHILSTAVALRDAPPTGSAFSALDAVSPRLTLPFDRPLFSPPAAIEMDVHVPGYADTDGEDYSALYTTVSVDKALLRNQIQSLLEEHDEVSLVQVIHAFPVKQGLAEVIGYLSLVQDNPNAAIVPHTNEPVLWQDADGNTHKADVCRVVYRRNTKEQQ